jgi:hypothetical protein
MSSTESPKQSQSIYTQPPIEPPIFGVTCSPLVKASVIQSAIQKLYLDIHCNERSVILRTSQLQSCDLFHSQTDAMD